MAVSAAQAFRLGRRFIPARATVQTPTKECKGKGGMSPMIKTLARSIREYKTLSILTPLLVTVEED